MFATGISAPEEHLKTGKGAAWWRYVEPKLVTRTDAAGAEIPVEVKLLCHICPVSYSATNESRLGESHLLKQLCPKLKDNPQKALEVATPCKKSVLQSAASLNSDSDSTDQQASRPAKKALSQSAKCS